MKAIINNIEYYLPAEIETGDDLLQDNPEWKIADIESKTGISVRHIATEEDMIEMARLSSEKIFSNGIDRSDVDLLILVTQSPKYPLPTSACILHDNLNLNKNCMAFDVNLGCSGFVYALSMCSSLIETGVAKNGLIVCSDTYTKYIDSSDRTCRPLFSDGAASIYVTSSNLNAIGPFELGTDGSGHEHLIVKSHQDNSARIVDKLHMNGSSVFMFTMNRVPQCVNALLEKSKMLIDNVDLFVFHQASKLVIDNLIRRLNLKEERVFVNYLNIGNTVSASIPIALKQAADEDKLQLGDNVMLIGFGVGLSWGACMIRYETRL